MLLCAGAGPPATGLWLAGVPQPGHGRLSGRSLTQDDLALALISYQNDTGLRGNNVCRLCRNIPWRERYSAIRHVIWFALGRCPPPPGASALALGLGYVASPGSCRASLAKRGTWHPRRLKPACGSGYFGEG